MRIPKQFQVRLLYFILTVFIFAWAMVLTELQTRMMFQVLGKPITDATMPVRALFKKTVYMGRPWYGLCQEGTGTTITAFREQVENDPVLKAHYRNFDWDRAYVFMAEKDMEMHVAYRISSAIAWTKGKIRIAQGEELITDGTHVVRTFCCNQIADFPLGPVLAEKEPPEEFLQPAVAQKTSAEQASKPRPKGESRQAEAVSDFSDASLDTLYEFASDHSLTSTAASKIPRPISSSEVQSPVVSGASPQIILPPEAPSSGLIPEPSSLLLFCIGIICTVLHAWLRHRRTT